MTLDELKAELVDLLPGFDDGTWIDTSHVNVTGNVVLQIERGGTQLVSDMSEHMDTPSVTLRKFEYWLTRKR